jgi:coenzyme F420 hydrogenase subunit beta
VIRRISTLKDVVDWELCTGCGACYYRCGKAGVTLVNVEGVGIRPRFDSSQCASFTGCLSTCPGYQVEAGLAAGPLAKKSEGDYSFGPALEIWEGYACDPEIRFRASSGGILSALALYCLEREKMEFVLHTAMDESKPWTNKTVQSTTRSEILARTGSRYAPASPCEGLGAIEESGRPCVFIGKPCDASAVAMLRKERPALDQRLGLVLAFFCAGTPSTRGTLNLLKSLEVAPEETKALRYRGEGWPGKFKVLSGNPGKEKSLSYPEAWGQLISYRPWRCHLCPDGLGRVADISCGDAWREAADDGDVGRSLVLVRTPRGQEILRRAVAAKYVELTPSGQAQVFAAQPNLIERRAEILGRLLVMRLLFVPTPRLIGFSLLRGWIRLPLFKKIRTVARTARRFWRRGWRRQPIF